MTPKEYENELYWAAGFFDGEGHISTRNRVDTRTRRPACSIGISIGQKDRRVLDRFQRVVNGGKVFGPYPKNDSVFYLYQVENYKDTTRIARLLWPIVSPVKQDQILKALEAIELHRGTIEVELKRKDVSV